MKIATFNVNSIRLRAPHVRRWIEKAQPDLLFLQEIKCETPAFPALEFAGLGYTAEAVGQKSYNGVAVLGRIPFRVTQRSLPGLSAEDAAAARYIEVEADGLTAAGIYLPNGNSGGDAGYATKLRWMDALADRMAAMMTEEVPFAVVGDYNVCPTDADLPPGYLPPTDALVRPETRARFRALLHLGYTDALRALFPTEFVFTFWDYQGAAWPRNLGLRIDHILLSPVLAQRLEAAEADKALRGEDQPSDHVPVWVALD
jgi:exodeoxyribonuclease-3